MGVEIAALMGFFGLTSAFALVATILAAWMAWRIVEKTGLPGWAGLGAILLTLTGVGSIVPLVLLWVFAFMRWPRDEAAGAGPRLRRGACGRWPGPARTAARVGAACRGLGRSAGMEARRQPARWRLRAHHRRIGRRLCPDRRAGRAARRALGARSLGRSPACQAHDRRRSPRPGGSGNRRRHLHRRGAPAARARSARHQRGPLDPSRHRRACAVEGLNRA